MVLRTLAGEEEGELFRVAVLVDFVDGLKDCRVSERKGSARLGAPVSRRRPTIRTMPQIPFQLLEVDVANDAIGEIGRDSQEMVSLAERFEGVDVLRGRLGPDLSFWDARDCARTRRASQ